MLVAGRKYVVVESDTIRLVRTSSSDVTPDGVWEGLGS